jgi:hypothetical protein
VQVSEVEVLGWSLILASSIFPFFLLKQDGVSLVFFSFRGMRSCLRTIDGFCVKDVYGNDQSDVVSMKNLKGKDCLIKLKNVEDSSVGSKLHLVYVWVWIGLGKVEHE